MELLKKYYKQRLPIPVIENKLKRSNSSIRTKAFELGITNPKKFSKEETEKLLKTSKETNKKMKICTICSTPKSVTEFNKYKSSKDGLKGECRSCQKEYNKKYREKNKSVIKGKKKDFYLRNKDSIRVYKREYYKKNEDRIRDYQKKWRKENEHILREYSSNYYESNKEKISRKNKEYRKNNPDVVKIARNNRKYRRKKLDSTLTTKEWEVIVKKFNNSCAYCGSKEKITQDHFIPVYNGGEYTHNNIIPACKSCNSSKQEKNFFEWYRKHKTYDEKREKKILQHLGYIDRKSVV